MIVISAALDWMTATMDDMPYWFIACGVALTVIIAFSGVLS